MVANVSINIGLLERLQQLALLQNITANALAERILTEYIEDMQDYQDAVSAYDDYKKNPVSVSSEEVCKMFGVK